MSNQEWNKNTNVNYNCKSALDGSYTKDVRGLIHSNLRGDIRIENEDVVKLFKGKKMVAASTLEGHKRICQYYLIERSLTSAQIKDVVFDSSAFDIMRVIPEDDQRMIAQNITNALCIDAKIKIGMIVVEKRNSIPIEVYQGKLKKINPLWVHMLMLDSKTIEITRKALHDNLGMSLHVSNFITKLNTVLRNFEYNVNIEFVCDSVSIASKITSIRIVNNDVICKDRVEEVVVEKEEQDMVELSSPEALKRIALYFLKMRSDVDSVPFTKEVMKAIGVDITRPNVVYDTMVAVRIAEALGFSKNSCTFPLNVGSSIKVPVFINDRKRCINPLWVHQFIYERGEKFMISPSAIYEIFGSFINLPYLTNMLNERFDELGYDLVALEDHLATPVLVVEPKSESFKKFERMKNGQLEKEEAYDMEINSYFDKEIVRAAAPGSTLVYENGDIRLCLKSGVMVVKTLTSTINYDLGCVAAAYDVYMAGEYINVLINQEECDNKEPYTIFEVSMQDGLTITHRDLNPNEQLITMENGKNYIVSDNGLVVNAHRVQLKYC